MREFWRRYKLFCQTILALAAFVGMNTGQTLKNAWAWLLQTLDASNSWLTLAWWQYPALGLPWSRVLLFILLSGLAFNAWTTWRFRNRPLSVLRTEITLRFEQGGAKCQAHRRQWLRANRPDVSAYYLFSSLSEAGASFGSGPEAWIESPNGVEVSCRVDDRGNQRNVDICYKVPMPYGWYVALLPHWLVTLDDMSRLPGIIRSKIAVQHYRYEALNEYSGNCRQFTARSPRYHHHRVVLMLDFSNDGLFQPKSEASIRVDRRLANALVSEAAVPVNDGRRHVYQVVLGGGLAKDEEVTVTW